MKAADRFDEGGQGGWVGAKAGEVEKGFGAATPNLGLAKVSI